MKIKKLEDQIVHDIEKLEFETFGSEEYKTGVDSITKMLDKVIEYRKLRADQSDKKRQREIEALAAAEEKRNKTIDQILKIIEIAIPSVITVWGTLVTLKFEETGTVTTIMGRGFTNKLLPKK